MTDIVQRAHELSASHTIEELALRLAAAETERDGARERAMEVETTKAVCCMQMEDELAAAKPVLEAARFIQDGSIAACVAAWAREHGGDPDLRIALCGYEGEHEMPGWHCHAWKARRGYAKDGGNASRERIWFSPHCLAVDDQQDLFEQKEGTGQ